LLSFSKITLPFLLFAFHFFRGVGTTVFFGVRCFGCTWVRLLFER
jgi:hypothetical protein